MKTKNKTKEKRFYVVSEGRKKGIFTDWKSVQASVIRHSGAQHQSFKTLAEAQAAFDSRPRVTTESQEPSQTINPAADVHIFCDGGCFPNPGKAGSGVVVYQSGALQEMYHGLYESNGTNNTAELNALHQAMLLAKSKLEDGLKVQILSDSQYAIGSMITWGAVWMSNGRMAGTGKPLHNRGLISDMYELYSSIKNSLDISHVKAHSGIEGNELADRLCILAVREKVKGFIPYFELHTDKLLALSA
jgi:ribonuclease HI